MHVSDTCQSFYLNAVSHSFTSYFIVKTVLNINSSPLSLTGRFINFLNLLLFLLKFCTYLTIFKNHIFAMRKFLQSLCELYLGWKIFTSLKVCQITFVSNSWMTWLQLLCFTYKLRKCIGVFFYLLYFLKLAPKCLWRNVKWFPCLHSLM